MLVRTIATLFQADINTLMNSTNFEARAEVRETEPGRLEAWGSRTFVQDALGGFYALREQMTREIGPEFTADIFYQAGVAAADRVMAYAASQSETKEGAALLDSALTLLTGAGYGHLYVEGEKKRPGEIVIHNDNSLEGEMLAGRDGPSGYVCDYVRGLLRGLLRNLPATEGFPGADVECVEIHCIGNGDAACRFVLASPQHLTQHGYRVWDGGHNSVRETLLRLNRQLEDVLEATKRDTLTGLYNRAHFESVLRRKIEHANRRTDTLAVALVDLDGFKEVNDGQGHATGDLALRQVARLLSSQARDTDVVARYGGDEFAWLMPGTSVEAALAVADRIRRLVKEANAQSELPLTLSIGIAACPEDASSMAELMDLADTAMYFAKECGGDQVKQYLPESDHRTASQKHVRKPRPRGGPAPSPKPPSLPDNGILSFDPGD